MIRGEVTNAKREVNENPLAAYRVFIEEENGLKGFFDPVEDTITRNQPIRILMYRGVKCDSLALPKNPAPKDPKWFGNRFR